jgi:hypothetical protein
VKHEQIAPEGFVAEGVVAEGLPALFEHPRGVLLDLFVEAQKFHDFGAGGSGNEDQRGRHGYSQHDHLGRPYDP